MRLINATDLKKAVIEFFDGVHLCDVNGADIIHDVNIIIDKAETIEARPRGKWIYKQESDYEFWECSNCGEPWDLIEGTPKDNNMNFCPNCGAQITEEATDDEI